MIAGIWERIEFARFATVHRRSRTVQDRWQEKHLRKIVRHAYENVPIWRELLRGIDVGSIRYISDIEKLPVTSKHTYIGRMAEDYINGSSPARAGWYVTSGTSGTPFTFLMSDHSFDHMYSNFASLRFLWWIGEPLKRLSTIRLARIKIRGPSTKYRLFVPVSHFLEDAKDAMRALKDFDAEMIAAYPSILIEMCRFIESDPKAARPAPKYIMSFGEMLTPATREYVSRITGAEIYDRYGLEEIGAVGVECRMHDGFHVNSESLIITITDDAYKPVPDGTLGRLVVTDLFNYNMPFLRYDTGDSARISYEQCACGLRSPRIWIEGRYSAYLSFGGRKIHHLEFDGAMDGFMNEIFQYQIAKIGPYQIEARIVPGPTYQDDVDESVTKNLQDLVGSDVAIKVKKVPSLPITPRGKCKIVVDEIVDIDKGSK